MERLLASGLCLNAEKCIIGVPELNFLGYIISAACIRPNPKKVKATSDAPKPQEWRSSPTEVISGKYYIPDTIRTRPCNSYCPLKKLTQKDVMWKWSTKETLNLKRVKELLTKGPSLAHYSMKAYTKLVVGTSPCGLGCILVQEVWDTEKQYSQIACEELAVPNGLQRMHSLHASMVITLWLQQIISLSWVCLLRQHSQFTLKGSHYSAMTMTLHFSLNLEWILQMDCQDCHWELQQV